MMQEAMEQKLWDENESLLFSAAENWKKQKEEEERLKDMPAAEVEVQPVHMQAAAPLEMIQELTQAAPALKFFLAEGERKLEEQRESAKKALLDRITSNLRDVSLEQMDGAAFVAEYVKTQDVLAHLTDYKKVDSICNLFENYFLLESHGGDVDLYDAYLDHLAALTSRELELLNSLHWYEKEMDLFFMDAYVSLRAEAMKKWNISEEMLEGMMISISRTGFCKEITGEFWGHEGKVFGVTEYFSQFLKYITKRNA